jgi:hypothetical protein
MAAAPSGPGGHGAKPANPQHPSPRYPDPKPPEPKQDPRGGGGGQGGRPADPQRSAGPPVGGPDLTSGKAGPDFSPGSSDVKGTEWDLRHSGDESLKDEKGNVGGARSALDHPPIGSGPDPDAESKRGNLPSSPSELGAAASPDTGHPHRQRPSPGEDDGSYDIDPEHPNRPGDPDPKIPPRKVEDDRSR